MTLFEKIIARQIPAAIVFEDDRVIAFRDIAPQAPTHVLVVPKEPLPGVSAMTEAHEALLGHVLFVARTVAEAEGLGGGYRLVINDGAHGGQTVPHLHVHVLGGRAMGWPPG